jgi:hypothetical protein
MNGRGEKVLIDPAEMSRLLNYMIEVVKEVVKLNDEITQLERVIDFYPEAYERYKRLIATRDARREQIRQIEELIRSRWQV